MGIADGGFLAARRELLKAELTDRYQHAVAGLSALSAGACQQAPVDELLEDRDGGRKTENGSVVALPFPRVPSRCRFPKHRFGRLQSEAAGENRQAAEESLLIRREQVVGPGDRVAQRAVAVRPVALAPTQEPQSIGQASEERYWVEQAQTRRRQLERERQAVQAATDFGDDGRVGFGQYEAGVGGSCPLHEERDRIGLTELFGIIGAARQLQWRHRQHLLAAQPERSAAGGQYLQGRAGREQLGDG